MTTHYKDGLRRAKAPQATCESDFAKLRAWFTSTGGFGASNRVTVQVVPAGGGSNTEYSASGGASLMTVSGFDGNTKGPADDATRAVFVAEMVRRDCSPSPRRVLKLPSRWQLPTVKF